MDENKRVSVLSQFQEWVLLQGGPKKSLFSKNENRPWWGDFEKKIHDQ